MISEPGVDHPDAGGTAELAVVGRDVTVDCRVVSTDDGVLVMKPSELEVSDDIRVRPGDQVRITWARVLDRRMVPATVIGLDGDGISRWRVRTTGPAQVEQRRTAVRARMSIPVTVQVGTKSTDVVTEDLSEGGALILYGKNAEPPRPKARIVVHLALGDDVELSVHAEVIRNINREGGTKLISVSFPGISERDEDRIRRRVFQALREERARINS